MTKYQVLHIISNQYLYIRQTKINYLPSYVNIYSEYELFHEEKSEFIPLIVTSENDLRYWLEASCERIAFAPGYVILRSLEAFNEFCLIEVLNDKI